MKLPLAHLDATVIEEVPIPLWRDLFNAVGWPDTLIGKKKSFSHTDVLLAFEQDEPTDELLLALEALHELGTESGRDAIVSAMTDRRVPASALPAEVGDREFALRLFLAQREDISLADVFSRAETHVQEGAEHRRYNEFMGHEARVITNLRAKSVALRDAILAHCLANDLGDHVQVRAFEEDGSYVFNVIRSHHTKRPLAIVEGRSARATIAYRPVHGDVIRFDGHVGRLRLAVRAASMVEVYRRTLGRVLFDDERFFTGEPVCSLRVLQENGGASLNNHSVSGIGRVRMTECVWERGDRDLVHLRSDDCFRSIEELRLSLAEGHLIQAKLKLEVAGRSTRPVTVTIRAPSRIEVTQKAHEQLIDEYLTNVGIRTAKSLSSEINLWSLYPWRHHVSTWRALFGEQTDTLVQEEILFRVQLNSIASAEHAGAGSVLAAQPVHPGEYYGVSRAPEVPSRSLSSTDVEGLELSPERLRLYLRSRLELTDPAAPWDGSELLDLGTLEVADHRFRLTYALRQPAIGTGDRVRFIAAGAHPVLLIPTSQFSGSELARAVFGIPIPSRARVIREVVAACGLTSNVPALCSAPENARLVVDSRLGKIWVDKVEVVGLHPETHPFRLVQLLAASSPTAISLSVLTDRLSGARKDGDTTARQAKAAAIAAIKVAMAGAGRTFDEDPFPSGPTGFYRCVLHAHVT